MLANAVLHIAEDFLGPFASPKTNDSPPPAVCVDGNRIDNSDLVASLVIDQKRCAVLQATHDHRTWRVVKNLQTPPPLNLGLRTESQFNGAVFCVNLADTRHAECAVVLLDCLQSFFDVRIHVGYSAR